ncbi:MAG: hypothetical protein AAB792_01075 [Patescibacteria group bacterium]
MAKRVFLFLTALSFILFVLNAQAPTIPAKKAAPAKKVVSATPLPTESQPATTELTVEQVVQLIQAGLSEDLVIAKIKKNNKAFDLSTEQLLQLKKAGASDNIIRAMMDPQALSVSPIPAPAPAAVESPSKVTTPAVVSPESTASSATLAPKTQIKVKVPDGEKIRLILMQDLSSATANEGDRVDLSVAEDVKVGEDVIIAKGAMAEGRVAEVKKKRMLGQGGKLLMSIERVRAVDGQNLRLRAISGREGDDKLGKTVVVGVLAGPFALLVKGKDVQSPRGTEYTAYLDESKEVVVSK